MENWSTDFSNKVSDTNVMYGVGVDGKINDTIKYRVAFERIRADGNIDKRIGRVLNNYLLMRDGFVPINIKFIDRADYYTAFNDLPFSEKASMVWRLALLIRLECDILYFLA
jgi:hypothetical protein